MIQLRPLLGEEILARYAGFANALPSAASLELLQPELPPETPRQEVLIENQTQITQILHEELVANLKLNLEFVQQLLGAALGPAAPQTAAVRAQSSAQQRSSAAKLPPQQTPPQAERQLPSAGDGTDAHRQSTAAKAVLPAALSLPAASPLTAAPAMQSPAEREHRVSQSNVPKTPASRSAAALSAPPQPLPARAQLHHRGAERLLTPAAAEPESTKAARLTEQPAADRTPTQTEKTDNPKPAAPADSRQGAPAVPAARSLTPAARELLQPQNAAAEEKQHAAAAAAPALAASTNPAAPTAPRAPAAGPTAAAETIAAPAHRAAAKAKSPQPETAPLSAENVAAAPQTQSRIVDRGGRTSAAQPLPAEHELLWEDSPAAAQAAAPLPAAAAKEQSTKVRRAALPDTPDTDRRSPQAATAAATVPQPTAPRAARTPLIPQTPPTVPAVPTAPQPQATLAQPAARGEREPVLPPRHAELHHRAAAQRFAGQEEAAALAASAPARTAAAEAEILHREPANPRQQPTRGQFPAQHHADSASRAEPPAESAFDGAPAARLLAPSAARPAAVPAAASGMPAAAPLLPQSAPQIWAPAARVLPQAGPAGEPDAGSAVRTPGALRAAPAGQSAPAASRLAPAAPLSAGARPPFVPRTLWPQSAPAAAPMPLTTPAGDTAREASVSPAAAPVPLVFRQSAAAPDRAEQTALGADDTGIPTVHTTRRIQPAPTASPAGQSAVRHAAAVAALSADEVEKLTEKVYRSIEKRLKTEKMRRGM